MHRATGDNQRPALGQVEVHRDRVGNHMTGGGYRLIVGAKQR